MASSDLGTVDIDAKELMASCTLRVRLHGIKYFTLKLRIADRLLELATKLIGCKYELLWIEED